MSAKSIVIWGAGRIGRGFVADLFFHAGYQLVFVDESDDLVEQLKKSGKYSIVRAVNAESINQVEISGYLALNTKQKKEISDAVSNSDLIATAVYPKFFKNVASDVSKYIKIRKERGNNNPINILLCTNLVHAGSTFKSYLYGNLTKEQVQYFDENVGIVESLVIRIAPDPPQSEVEKDPLVVWTNGYPELPVEEAAFKGNIPKVESLRLVEDMRAEELRKIYTYNMCHAVLSYHGHMEGYKLLVDCLADSRIRKEAEGALHEASEALQIEYGFSQTEMEKWIKGVLEQTNNPTVGDTVIRSAADPLRKLRREDRLIGPASLCMKHHIQPSSLVRAIGAAFHFFEKNDEASKQMIALVDEKGIKNAIHEICGLRETEQSLIKEIIKAYKQVALEVEWQKKAKSAFYLAHEYEKKYHGCGQSVVAAVYETLEIFDDEVFNSSTGLCGGIGLVNEASCSAFTAGAMAIGMIFPRRRENFDGDRENKYITFRLVQALREKFISEYGSICCADIHAKKYGRSFDLRLEEERNAFEDAGGHGEDGCTDVVGKASKWTVEIISESLIEDELKNEQRKEISQSKNQRSHSH